MIRVFAYTDLVVSALMCVFIQAQLVFITGFFLTLCTHERMTPNGNIKSVESALARELIFKFYLVKVRDIFP
jgi:hypothetical protein